MITPSPADLCECGHRRDRHGIRVDQSARIQPCAVFDCTCWDFVFAARSAPAAPEARPGPPRDLDAGTCGRLVNLDVVDLVGQTFNVLVVPGRVSFDGCDRDDLNTVLRAIMAFEVAEAIHAYAADLRDEIERLMAGGNPRRVNR